MQIFLDTANMEEIEQGVRWGVLSGVTTNPSLAAKEGIGETDAYRKVVVAVCQLVDGPVSAEVLSIDALGMVEEGRNIATWHPNVVVKLPSTAAGLEAMSILSKENIVINQTLCFSVNQALLGAQAGASFVSPFVGRLVDEGHDGMQLVSDIVSIFRNYNISTKVLAASIRDPLQCVEAAKCGADIVTIPFKVLSQMIQHSLTDVGVARFTSDWKSAKKP